jgi:cell wall-associated NlpC family hydrolase
VVSGNQGGTQLAFGLVLIISAAVIVDSVFTGRNPWVVVKDIISGQGPPPKVSPGTSGAPSTSTGTPTVAPGSNSLIATKTVGSIAVVIAFALSQIGKPYKVGPGRFGPDYYDCSGFVYAAYKAAGITLTQISQDQAQQGIPVKIDPAYVKPGDLIIMQGAMPPNDHVALALNATQMISAPGTGQTVHITNIPYSGIGSSQITTIRRIISQ